MIRSETDVRRPGEKGLAPLFLFFFVLFVVPFGFTQERRALSIADIEELLRAGVGHRRVAEVIGVHGVNFEVTAAVRERLERAGADAAVIQAVEKAGLEFARKKLEEERRKAEEERQAEVEKRKAE
ncbi:MAG: hypothetical protein HY694_15165 [Deltaproteobacteria bacterium]|nr:hypothetical protein [Deltaproteobacteria bacterium]